jgi:hypothetical protein
MNTSFAFRGSKPAGAGHQGRNALHLQRDPGADHHGRRTAQGARGGGGEHRQPHLPHRSEQGAEVRGIRSHDESVRDTMTWTGTSVHLVTG